MTSPQKATEIKSDHLIDGKYGIVDLVDIGLLRQLCERFSLATGFTIGFLDHPGMNLLISTGWKDICTKFHRGCAASESVCIKSNRKLIEALKEPGKVVVEYCDNGLVDCATPIFVEGKHIASLATGQMFIKNPDIEQFKRQAKIFNFDEIAYLDALSEVEIINEEKLKSATGFLGDMALMISQIGYVRLKLQKEINQRELAQADLENHRLHLEQVNKEIRQQARSMEAMTRQLLATQEDMRRRLSSSLHDRTSPNLAALRINLELITQDLSNGQLKGLTDRIEDTAALLKDTDASIREISAELRPPLLDYAGLVPALMNYSSQFSRRTGIEVNVRSPKSELLLSADIESLLFRVAQEALTNCAKHAAATEIEVRLEFCGDLINLIITDNGIGFSSEGIGGQWLQKGLGLVNMKEMAQNLGGTFTVDSKQGKGTQLYFLIPMVKTEE